MSLRSLVSRRRALLLALALNVLFAAAYLWSRGGQATHVRVEARGDEFVAYIDGRRSLSGTLDGPATGGIALTLDDATGTPTLPGPHGVERVRVTDLATGETLFDDAFEGEDDGAWSYALAEFTRTSGLLRYRGEGLLTLTRAVDWRDYAVDIDLRNVPGGALTMRTGASGRGVTYRFGLFRHLDQYFFMPGDSTGAQPLQGPPLEPGRTQMVRGMLAMLLRPYPWLLLIAVAALAVSSGYALAASRVRRGGRAGEIVARGVRLARENAWYPVELLAIAAFGVTAFIIYRYTGHAPNWPDSVSYVFQSKVFASGRLAAPAPPVTDAFDYFYPPLTLVDDGRWASIFPFGHPLLLAPGELFGASWVVPPLLAAASIGLLFAIGRRWYGGGTAFAAALLLATSPFFLMQSSNYMSHVSALFYLLVALAGLVLPATRSMKFAALAGIAFGLLFNTRPLTAAVLAPSFLWLLAAPLLAPETRAEALRRAAGFAAGGLLMLVAYGIFNYGTTGDPFTSAYFSSNQVRLGFGGAHSVSAGIQNEQTALAYLLLVLDGWPSYVGLAFVLVPFLLGTRDRWDWFCLASALAIIGSYTLFAENGIMQGPRLWYEAVPFLLLLTARGVETAARAAGDAATALLARAHRAATADPAPLARLFGYGALAALVAGSAWGWLLARHDNWNVEFVPENARAMRDFNGINDRLTSLVERERVRNALVLVDPCPHWQCYGSVFWRNDPALKNDVIYARNLPERNADVLRAFPDREVWIANYNGPYVVPWGTDLRSAALPRIEPGTRGPLARDVLASLGAPPPP